MATDLLLLPPVASGAPLHTTPKVLPSGPTILLPAPSEVEIVSPLKAPFPYRWSANGGYANRGDNTTRGKTNKNREVVWFSPHCLKPEMFVQRSLFEAIGG